MRCQKKTHKETHKGERERRKKKVQIEILEYCRGNLINLK